jgi:hypothetical protein
MRNNNYRKSIETVVIQIVSIGISYKNLYLLRILSMNMVNELSKSFI